MSKTKYKDVPIKKIGNVVTGKTPLTAKSEYYNGSYMFISPNELHEGYLISKSEKTITEKGLKSIATNSISGTSVLVGCIGWDMGNVAMCLERCATNQQINSITNFKSEYNPYYIYYWLLTRKEYLFSIASVTRTPILSKGTFEDILIPVPGKPTQDKIAGVLLSIDQKIQLNNKINETLQEQASLMYDYWFTQFDFPDENGKPYKSSGGKMVYNELLKREIPEGWKVAKLLDIANWIGGSQPPKSEHIDFMKEGYVRFIQNRDYAADNHMTYIPITNSNKLCSEYDIMIDKYGDAGKIRFGLAGAYNVALSKIEVKKENAQEYVRRFLESDGIKQYLSGSCIASTRASLNETNLSFLKIAIPLESVLLRFEKLSKKTISLILNNNRETQELTRLRDWLLPMLMNGQATVAEEQKPIFQVIENGTKNEQPDRFALWLQNQGLAARGDIDRQTLREIFDAMDDDDK